MSIITVSYFNGTPNNIPNIDKTYVSEPLQTTIDTLEPVYLQKILGYELARDFIAGIEEVTPLEKWTNLLNGVEFSNDGILSKWTGFEDATTFNSPIADYVMFNYTRRNASLNSGIGEIKAKNINAETVSPITRIGEVWNSMVDKNILLYNFLISSSDYPEYNNQSALELFKRFSIFGITI